MLWTTGGRCVGYSDLLYYICCNNVNVSKMFGRCVVFAAFLFFFTFTMSAEAVCPVCTVMVGAGVGVTRWLGLDDSITGSWIGGLLMSLSVWTKAFMEQRGIRFFGKTPLIVAFYYIFGIWPLYWMDIIDDVNTVSIFAYDINRLLLGVVSGSAAVIIGAVLYGVMKKKHGNRAYFPFQKVAMPLFFILLVDVLFCLLLP